MSDLIALLLIRRPQPLHHVQGLTGGWTDTGLSDMGRERTGLLALLAAHHVESSDR